MKKADNEVDLSEFKWNDTQVGCKFLYVWDKVTDEQLAKLRMVLPSDSRVTHSSIAGALNRWGKEGKWSMPGAAHKRIYFDSSIVGRHRRGECKCEEFCR